MSLKVLFVCTANLDRSPKAEEMTNEIDGVEAKSAGIRASLGGGGRVVDGDLVEWADEILVMEEKHREYLVENFSEAGGKIKVLGIPDKYCKQDQELEELLKEKLSTLR